MGPTWAHRGTLLVPSWIPCGSEMDNPGTTLVPWRIPQGSLMGQPWTQLGTSLVPFRIHLGSLMEPLRPISEPSWFLRGFILDPEKARGPTWTQFGTILVLQLKDLILGPFWNPIGSLSHPLRFSDGSKLDPSWNHRGFRAVKFWILEGLIGPLLRPYWFF